MLQLIGRMIFSKFEDLSQTTSWLGRLDSNQRMTISKTVALPLGDAPKMVILYQQNLY